MVGVNIARGGGMRTRVGLGEPGDKREDETLQA